jgi:putative RNase toxin 4 of polymorphic toxin system
MPSVAPRTPARASARPPRRPAPAPGPTRIRVPRAAPIVEPGPAIKITNKAAQDPRFKKVIDKLEKSAAKIKTHPPAAQKSAEAQAAAQPPANEKMAGAKASQVDSMKEADTKKPEPSSFLDMLRAEIQKVMPKNLSETEEFMKGDKKRQLKGALTGNINQQKEEAASGMKGAAKEPPDPSRVEAKEVTPLPGEAVPVTPQVGAAEAMPAPKSDAEVSLQQSKQDADQMLADQKLTPAQLKKANDPRFSAVLTAKATVEKQADSAPLKYRGNEQKVIAGAASLAVADERKGLMGFKGQKGVNVATIKARQLTAKQKDEAERKKVTDHIEGIYNNTKRTVEEKLAKLETDVSTKFDQGMEAALKKMTDYIDTRLGLWKTKRYLGNPLLWLKDKFLDLPSEVNVFYTDGRKVLANELDALVVNIANLVESRLNDAKAEIARGQKEIGDYVKSLPTNLQAVGKAAEKEMAGRFDELRQSVDDKKSELAQTLAQRYKEAFDKADVKLKEMKAENKGLLTALKEKIAEVAEALRNFKARIMGMLKNSGNAIELIRADPIGFLSNLLDAIKRGIRQFSDKIWEHLKEGFMAWLFGTLGEAGIQLPKDYTPGSILILVLQVLGITYEKMRAKAVKLVGPRAVAIIEGVGKAIHTLITSGPAQLWEMAKEYLSNLKETIVEGVKEWAVTAIIKAAVTKLAMMFNPVGAIIQAILMIYNTVMFFIERINQILAFVEAIIASIFNIATGKIADAANWIEKALARTIPLIIAFLARLLNLSGVTDTIKRIIKKIQMTVDKAIDKVIEKVVAGVKKLFSKGKPDDRTEEEKNRDLHLAIEEATTIAKDNGLGRWVKTRKISQVKGRYRLTSLEVVKDSHSPGRDTVHVRGVINPTYDGQGFIISDFPPQPKIVIQTEIGAPQPRQGSERVLLAPGKVGLRGFERAHLLGAGFGAESSLGIFYTPSTVNQELQNRGIELFIRQMYAQRAPNARFFIRASAQPHPGTQILARVVYTVSGQLPGEPVTDIFEVRIIIKDASLTPKTVVLVGEVDEAVLGEYTPFINTRLSGL